jgi:transcriptional pleiotropic regulator of transition state genes
VWYTVYSSGKNSIKKEGKTMKSTGIIRRIDELGRIVIPMEIRKNLHVNERDFFEIFVDGEKICLQKYRMAESYKSALENIVNNIDDDYEEKAAKEIKKKLKEVMKML